MSQVEYLFQCELMEPSQYNSHIFEASVMLTLNKTNSWSAKTADLPLCMQDYQNWQSF
jgi:hypothetical protein